MSQTPYDFSKQLIKGKIAELVFDQMFRRASGYTVIPFGYESVIPSIAQYTNGTNKDLLEHIKNVPDFALVRHDPKEVRLVEVKFRTKFQIGEMKETVARISEQWKLAWLFVATPERFYFDLCTDIENQVMLTPLSEGIIPKEIQNEYLKLVTEFI